MYISKNFILHIITFETIGASASILTPTAVFAHLHLVCLNIDLTITLPVSRWIRVPSLVPISPAVWPPIKKIRTQRLIYEGRSINKLQNDIILFIFKIWKYAFCSEFNWGHINIETVSGPCNTCFWYARAPAVRNTSRGGAEWRISYRRRESVSKTRIAWARDRFYFYC